MAKSLEERMAIVKEILSAGPSMDMPRPLKAGTLKNRVYGGCCTGYTFEVDNLGYRGAWISTIEKLTVKVDGETVPESDILVCIRGMKIPVCDLGGHSEVFWDARDRFAINVYQVGGLAPGEHRVAVEFIKRLDFGHSYGEAEQGYDEAVEFHNPWVIGDEAVFTI